MPKLYEMTPQGAEAATLLCAKQVGIPVDNSFLLEGLKKILGQLHASGVRFIAVEGSPFANAFEGRDLNTSHVPVRVAAPAPIVTAPPPAPAHPSNPEMIMPGRPLPAMRPAAVAPPPTIPPHEVPAHTPMYTGPMAPPPVPAPAPAPRSVQLPTTQSE